MGMLRSAIVILGLASYGAVAGAAGSNQALQLNIVSQPIGDALNEFARQTGLQVVIDPKEGKGVTAPSVMGAFTARDALEKLLANTGLRFEYLNERTVAVRAVSPQMRPAAGVLQKEATRLAQVETAAENSNTPLGDGSNGTTLEEITVTAQKRVERLQDVPVPVTTISGEVLANSNLQRVQDYYSRIPGLSLTTGAWGEPRIAIRGIITDPLDNPTVGVTVDDLPYGSSANLAGNGGVPDIDPGDLARVEVLRGPQGTLYGASGMGGLIKFVTIDPSTTGFSGRVQAGLNGIRNGDEMGYSVRGSVNVPISDTWAVRASGFTRQDPGYIDNVRTDKQGVNWGKADGGRLSAMWKPSDVFSLKLNALAQSTAQNGAADVDGGLGDLRQNNTAATGDYHRDSESYSATISAGLGNFDLISVSGYNIDTFKAVGDLGPGVTLPQDVRTTKFTQEVRLTTALGSRVDWLVGAFYTDEKNVSEEDVLLTDPDTGVLQTPFLIGHFPNTFREYAAFTDLTLRLTDRFDVQIGGRESRFKQSYRQSLEFFLPPSLSETPEANIDANAFTYLFTPRLKITPDLMAYARLASGYRAGGPNSNTDINPQIPAAFAPDKTKNYELGIKGDFLDRLLSFDASIYYIDWKDIQLKIQDGTFSYRGNGGRAKSQGVELSMEARPIKGLTLATWIAWNDAELTEDMPAGAIAAGIFGLDGDQLPFSSRISGNFSVDEEFQVVSNVTGFVGGTFRYVDERKGIFVPQNGVRSVYPSYTQTDLRAGARYESWTLSLFVNNVTDQRGVLTDVLVPTSLIYIQPRTVGLSVAKTF
jgi:outer membrane receptor protein involved in Fe transport